MILSRADSEALNLNIQPLGLPRLLESITDRLGPQAEARHVGLRLEIGPGIPPAQADSDRLEQVLVNLLDNAIKYSQPGGTVTVSVEGPREAALLVRVHDQGIGIPAEELDRIGERFYRADRARSRAAGGSGLGLAIARALVEAHGGALWIESEEGHGTTVSFSLPAATP
jgi:two-component system phosphate regulon sensor histidine kinase PhoR